MSGPLSTGEGSPPSAGLTAHSPLILLVEDDVGLRAILKTMLEGQGYTVVAAKTGDEAFRLCLQGGQAIDVMLIDIVLPGINGLDLIQMVLSQWPNTKIIAMSGQLDVMQSAYSFCLGRPGTAYLPKPFAPGDVLETVRSLLASSPEGTDHP
jgi:DNA-binding response OmpR family regulator